MSHSPILANDFQRQWADVGADVHKAVERVGQSGWYVLGREVEGFESELAAYWGLKHAVGAANGMDAIEIGLRCLGCGPGDRVLTTPLSAFATTLAILRIGAIPIFVDVDRQGLIDLTRCYELLRRRSDIRFFLPVHLYGHALDRGGLEWLRDEFDLRIVEDCAQSVGSTHTGLFSGTVGQIAATSFYPTKTLGAMGDGGALLMNDPMLAEKARVLRSYGETSRYRHEEIGCNSRLDELQAAVLRDACLPRLNRWIARRRSIAELYGARISNPTVRLPGTPEDCRPSWHLFPIHVNPEQRGEFMQHMNTAGVATAIHYPTAIPDQPAMGHVDFEFADNCAHARRICASEVSLPIHPYLKDDEVESVIAAVNAFGRTVVRHAA